MFHFSAWEEEKISRLALLLSVWKRCESGRKKDVFSVMAKKLEKKNCILYFFRLEGNIL